MLCISWGRRGEEGHELVAHYNLTPESNDLDLSQLGQQEIEDWNEMGKLGVRDNSDPSIQILGPSSFGIDLLM